MEILYLGQKDGNAKLRAFALERCGHDLLWFDYLSQLPKLPKIQAWIRWTGGWGLWSRVQRSIAKLCKGKSFDAVLVNGGALLPAKTLKMLREHSDTIILYNNDDPFGQRDLFYWKAFRTAVSEYDLLAFPRKVNVKEAEEAGAKKAIQAWMTADELAHPYTKVPWVKSVLFIGTWFPGRDEVVHRLLELGVDIEVYGGLWCRAPRYRDIQHVIKGEALHGREYCEKIGGGRLCLGLLSKENRDLHTRRSVEIPAIGGLLLAERTSEHMELYEDGVEAVFWESLEECADHVKTLLEDPDRVQAIAKAGHEKVKSLKLYNEDLMTRLLNEAGVENLGQTS